MSNKTNAAMAKINSSAERRLRKIFIPEWDLTIYVKTWTLNDSQKIKGLQTQDNVLIWAAIVQIKAMNEAGEPMFSISERQELANVGDADILQRLALQIGRPISMDATAENPEVIDPLPPLDELTDAARKNS